ncbi:LytTR family DNA-binding domain-containing protein [Psychrobium sp. nBUS_13]|uniref:LytTR family DNA-binding domain-containing protein n=1 Tax=Psychrobium sp. nBUS_13 TaxID=3395319 RepID=UPI003EB6BDFC
MNGQVLLGAIRPTRYFIFLAFTFGLLFALMDNSENFDNLFFTMVVWQIQTQITMAFFVLSHHLLIGKLGQITSWKKLVVSALITSCFFTPVSLMLDVLILADDTFTLNALLREWMNMAPPAVLCWVVINLPWTLGVIKSDIPSSQTPTQPLASFPKIENEINDESVIATTPHFFNLCGLTSIDDLLYLKAELHYLNVVTTQRETLILYNLKDAISELAELNEDYTDWRTHRSFWVNKSQMMRFTKVGREGKLAFNYDHAPDALVSRQHTAKVKAW